MSGSGGAPAIILGITTYFPPGGDGYRRWYAVEETMQSWARYLNYDGPLRAIVADDGSDPEHVRQMVKLLEDLGWEPAVSVANRQGYGASLNRIFRAAEDLVFHGVDDWALKAPFDLTPWAHLLLDPSHGFGMVRLGPPHPWISGTVEMFEDGWVLRLARHNVVCGLRPSLFRRSFWTAYGPFAEGVSALETEYLFNTMHCDSVLPDRPAAGLALPHPWEHVHSIALSSLSPEVPR